MKSKLPLQPLTKLVNKEVGEERRLIDDDHLALVKKADMRPSEDEVFDPGMSGDYLGNLLNRSKEPEDDILNSVARGSLTGYTSECLDRRTDNDGRLLRNDLLKNRFHDDHGTLGSFRFGSPEDTFDEVRRLADGGSLLAGEVVNDKFRVDSDLDSILLKEYPVGLLDVKTDDDDKLVMRNRTVGGYDTDNRFGSAFSTEHRGKLLYRSRLGINDDRFLIGDHGEKEYNHHHTIEPVVSNVGNLDERLENRHGMDCIRSPVSASERLGSVHNIRKTTGDGWFATNERIGGEPHLGSHLVPGLSTKNFGNPLNSGCRTINDAKISKSEGGVSENIVDSIRFSTTLNKNSGYVTSVGGRMSDDGRFRNDNQVEIGEAIDTFARPVISTEFTTMSKMKQNALIYPNSSRSTRHDTTDVPFPGHTRSPNQRFSSFAANGNSSSVQETPCRWSGGNLYLLPKSGSPAYALEAEGSSRHLDVASAYRYKAILPPISDHPSKYFLNADLSNHLDVNSSAYLDYRISSFPNPSLASLAALRIETFEQDKGSGSYALSSMENPNSGKDGNFPLTSGGLYQHIIYPEVDKTLAGQDFLYSNKQDSSLGMYHHEEDSLNYDKDFKSSKENIISYEEHLRHSKAPSKDSKSNRRSVFTRLTSGPVAQVQEEENSNYVCYDESYMDSSVNEVMDLLHQGLNNRVRVGKKPKKCKPFHTGCNYEESGLDERQAFVDSNIEVDQSMTTRYMKDIYGAIDENDNEVLKETRSVDFKRRSETKKKLIETSTKTNPSIEGMISRVNAEVDSLAHKSCKRRKLVRPIFTKNDSVDEGVISNPSGNYETVLNAPEAKMRNPDTGLSNMISKRSHELGDANTTSSFKSKGLKIRSFSSRSHKLEEGKETSNVPETTKL